MSDAERQAFFLRWARERVGATDVKGVYVLICRSPGRIEVVRDEALARGFTMDDRDRLIKRMRDQFDKKSYDQGLQDGVAVIAEAFAQRLPRVVPNPVLDAVKDYAGFFSPAAVQKATDELKAIRRDLGKDVVIETFASVAAARVQQVEAMAAAERNRYFERWVQDRMRRAGVDGIFVLICKQPRHLQVEVGRQTAKVFTQADINKLQDVLRKEFGEKRYDAGLAAGVALIRDSLKGKRGVGTTAGVPQPARPTPPAPPVTPPAATSRTTAAPGVSKSSEPSPGAGAADKKGVTEPIREKVQAVKKGFNVMTLIWIVVGLIGLWIVIGLIRSLFRPRPQWGPPPGAGYASGPGQAAGGPGYAGQRPAGPGPGYGGGYGPGGGPPPGYGGGYYGGPGYGGGGGGGGFMSGLLGGMFGAAAGSWVYDRMFRPSGSPPTSGAFGSGAYYGGTARAAEPARDTGNEPAGYGAGGDFGGEDAATGDAGAGADFGDQARETGDAGAGADFGDDAGQAPDAGSGADFGGDQAAADYGGAGGDFGGGSAVSDDGGGGGGDFGGGGGDFGGGGGGDFGGGGGDFGGGGDAGGGDAGGGGDF